MSKAKITPLGTVSPYGKGERNCPGFMVEYKGHKVLLDCGNGITRLMNMPECLNNLHVIITHYHKDHFGDLGALQYASYVYHNLGKLKQPVKVYLPNGDFANNESAVVSNTESFVKYSFIVDGSSFAIEDLTISFADNHSHTIESYMVKLQCRDFKMVYTSDIGNTNFDHAVAFCKDSDLIICESSFLRKHNANSQTHLTAYDAGLLAKRSSAKKLLLTHFWPEEDRALYVEEAQQVFADTSAAEEGVALIY